MTNQEWHEHQQRIQEVFKECEFEEIDEFENVRDEYFNALAKHPEFPTDIFQQLSIMQEEAGEVAKAVNDYYFGGKPIEDVKTELRQTAAMCIRMLINLEGK